MSQPDQFNDVMSGDALTYDYDVSDELSSLNIDLEILTIKLETSENDIRELKERLNQMTSHLWGKQRDYSNNRFGLLINILAVVLGVVLTVLAQLIFNISI